MATPVVVLAERADIHKSCKSLELLVNVLNDYCEAAGAVVSLQKKLVKALRETAGQKTTGEIAGNAMNTSATVFEALSDIDAKFSKIADKEYDTVSSEVKKWFKKLAKEEKAHDDRVERSNARIRQAGQSYEKKSKKNARDAAEEHSKYINLISTLGPEMTQEKYNHTVLVSQRHTLTTYAVAACVSKVADAEWLRSCEGVRKFSPTIGPLGEWRALCEGGWTGAVPRDLPDLDAPSGGTLQRPALQTSVTRRDNEDGQLSEREDDLAGQQAYLRQRQARNSPEQSFYSSNSGPTNSDLTTDRSNNTLPSMSSLASFPAPPTHFPIPPLASPVATRPPPASRAPSYQSRSATSSHSNPSAPALLTVAEAAPFSEEPGTISDAEKEHVKSSEKLQPPPPPQEEPSASPVISAPPSPTVEKPTRVTFNDEPPVVRPAPTPERAPPSPEQTLALRSSPREPASRSTRPPSVPTSSFARGDYLVDDQEFGVRGGGSTSKTLDTPKSVQRSDTGTSNGSVVAAMRNRYSYTGGATSPPPRDVPRLPLSVTDLATRYQPTSDSPTQYRPTSPEERSPPPQQRTGFVDFPQQRGGPSGYARSSSRAELDREYPRRRDEREDTTPRDRSSDAREHELRQREREIEARSRELERERAQLNSLRGAGDGYSSDTARRAPSKADPVGQQQRPTVAVPRPSYASTHLVPPSPSGYERERQSHSRTASPVGEHPSDCTCASCVIAKHGSRERTPSYNDPNRPPEAPIVLRPKQKGWMRRLSMPVVVGNAFSLDGKKNVSSATLRSTVEEDGRYQRRSVDMMGNQSVTNLGRH